MGWRQVGGHTTPYECSGCGRLVEERDRPCFEVTWDCVVCLGRLQKLAQRGALDQATYDRMRTMMLEHRRQDQSAAADERGDAANFWVLYPRLPQHHGGMAA